jgi:hypothetical protein
VTFCDATLHCPPCPVDFTAFTLFRLAEDCQQDDVPPGNDVISDALIGVAEMEAKLSELSVELLCVRLTEIHSFRAQQVDVELGLTELAVAEAFEPFPDFRFKLYLSPLTHSEDDIPIGRRSTTLEWSKSLFSDRRLAAVQRKAMHNRELRRTAKVQVRGYILAIWQVAKRTVCLRRLISRRSN